MTDFRPKKCTVSLREGQFATLHLFHAYRGGFFAFLFFGGFSLFFLALGEERTWAIAIRPFYANQSSELNFPIFIGKKGPEFGRKRYLYEPLLTAMAQVLPSLIFSCFSLFFCLSSLFSFLVLLEDKGRRLQFAAKMGNFTPTSACTDPVQNLPSDGEFKNDSRGSGLVNSGAEFCFDFWGSSSPNDIWFLSWALVQVFGALHRWLRRLLWFCTDSSPTLNKVL